MRERAHEVADILIGTAETLHAVLTADELQDADLLSDIDALVKECSCCGWWVEVDECNDADECEDCQGE